MTNSESIVVKPREFSADLLLPENADELAKFMDEPLSAIAEAITGAMASGPRSWMVMGGHVVQAMLKGRLFQQVSQEIKDLRDKGKIPADFAEKKYGFKSWVELLKVIDDEAPDEDRLEALKAMFYSVNKVNLTDREQVFNYQLFQIAKRLTSGEVLLLDAVYKVYASNQWSASPGTLLLRVWATSVASQAGHGSADIVMRDQRALEKEGLITARVGIESPDLVQEEQSVVAQNARITPLGIKFHENIKNYRTDVAQL